VSLVQAVPVPDGPVERFEADGSDPDPNA
jgi:hypothetical protein